MSRLDLPQHDQRGAVVVETALVAGMILTMLLFSVQIGVLGFLQVTSDAASFVDAHINSVGTASGSQQTLQSDAATDTANTFTQLSPSDITVTPLPAPTASIPVNYGYNGTAGEQQNSGSDRVGGASMLQPTLSQSQVVPHETFNMFGNTVGVASLGTEPQWEECGVHYNVENSTNLTCGGASPTPIFQGSYFTTGENTPPYYVGFNYVQHCDTSQPWQQCTARDFLSLGIGEFLYANSAPSSSSPGSSTGGNWERLIGGISGARDTSTFQEAACHQRVYANLAAFFANYSDLQTLYTDYMGSRQTGTISTMFKSKSLNDYSQWREFEVCAAGLVPNCQSLGQAADGYIDEIYSWDERVQVGNGPGEPEPGSYRDDPDNLC